VTGPIRVERSGPAGVVARVILDRPEIRNALDATMIGALRQQFVALATEGASELRAVVLG